MSTRLPTGQADRGRECGGAFFLAKAEDVIRANWPAIDQDRERVQAALDLPPAYDLLPALHAAAADENYRPINEHGDRYRSMHREP